MHGEESHLTRGDPLINRTHQIKEYIRLKIRNYMEDHTKGMNGNKMHTNDKENQKEHQESNNINLGKIKNNKYPEAKREQHTVRNKLKEDLQIMCHKVWILQMYKRERLLKLKENSKLVKLKKQIWNDGITLRRV